MWPQKSERLLFLICLILLPTQLGRHFWPNFSFIYSLPIDYFSPTLYLWNILVVGLAILWLAQKPKIKSYLVNLVFLFLLTQSLSLFDAQNLGAGLVMLSQLMIALMFGLYLAHQDFKKIKNLIYLGLSVGVIMEGLIAIGEFLKSGSLGLWWLGERAFNINTPSIAKFDFFSQVFLRPYATFPHPNVLAAFMVISLVLIYQLKPASWSKALAAISILLTFSRTAILVLLLEGLIVMRKRWKQMVGLVIIVTPLLFIRFSSAFNFDYLSILRREELASIALSDFKTHPILGIGLNNFISQTALSELVSGPNRFLQPVHNLILLSLSETGLIGFLGLLVLLSYPIWQLWKKKNKPLLFIWGIIFFLGMFDHYFLTLPQGQRLLFFIWGLSFIMD